ncbi:MAG: phosphogluconate dehydrogenase (NAD(+)-dependent, decarboxylating) [Patescibacteria group bacterium]
MKNNSPKTAAPHAPTILVVFGATGDLIGKKILPALFHLFKERRLPKKFHVFGFSRRNLSDESFRAFLGEKLTRRLPYSVGTAERRKFLGMFSFHRGLIDAAEDYHSLAVTLKKLDENWGVCANKLFYLAVPPHLYETILNRLASSELTKECPSASSSNALVDGFIPLEASMASSLTGWSRIIVEKPFGKNAAAAKKLDLLLGALFKEEQIYRVDHYLAKEMLQNILTFRFGNNLFEQIWNSNFIEKIEIKLLEKIGVEDRGAFYDGVGALRDVGQNHLLQMLALVTMEHPASFDASAIRAKRAAILKSLLSPNSKDVARTTFRAQYKGYKKIKGVSRGSRTETYFKAEAKLDTPRWRDTQITLESGKRLGESIKEIILYLRHPSPCLCPPRAPHHANRIVIRLEPQEEIDVAFWAKKPGFEYETEERKLNFLLRNVAYRSQYTEEYEKLFLDCISGNQTLFLRTEEVEAMWRFTEPITSAWEKNLVPLETYKPDSDAVCVRAAHIGANSGMRGVSGFPKEIGIIGLGKMGANVARNLREKGWRVVAYNRTPLKTEEIKKEGIDGAYTLHEFLSKLASPRIVWIMLPAGRAVEKMLFGKNGIVALMDEKDIVIEAGNSFYKDSIRREKLLKKRGIRFLDAGVSGGPGGARNGAAIMIGGDKKLYNSLQGLWSDLSVRDGYGYMGSAGAGHFVKMVHNGIEYGMMQAIGEGFEVLKKSEYKLNLKSAARVYSRGTVIESRLVNWLISALEIHGKNLTGVSGSVSHTGEGAWTVKTAREEKVKAKIIEEALKFRMASAKHPSFTGKVVSALREQFGGHDVRAKKLKVKTKK